MEGTHFLPFILYQEKKPGKPLQQFITHGYLGNLIYLSGKSHILKNSASLARGQINYPSGNTTAIYLDAIFSASKC